MTESSGYCKEFARYGDVQMIYCGCMVTVVVFSILVLLVILYQLFVYLVSQKIPWSDLRITILLLCLANITNVVIHYAFLNKTQKAKTFFTIEIGRFTIFYIVSYYYLQKASGLI